MPITISKMMTSNDMFCPTNSPKLSHEIYSDRKQKSSQNCKYLDNLSINYQNCDQFIISGLNRLPMFLKIQNVRVILQFWFSMALLSASCFFSQVLIWDAFPPYCFYPSTATYSISDQRENSYRRLLS